VKLQDTPKYLATAAASLAWPAHSRLFIKGDSANWSLYWDAVELTAISRQLGIPVIDSRYKRLMKNQCFFNMSRYEFLENWQKPNCRIAFPYYHGNPDTDAGSRRMLKTISQHHQDISRIQVSCRLMEEVVLNTGISKEKVFRIPIGINGRYFRKTTAEIRTSIRKVLGIPQNAVVIGSFQKDGVGMQEGLEPKLIKGPDVLLKTLSILHESIPELFVLLTGPARGFVKKGLEAAGIPYAHRYLKDYTEIGTYFNALDAYIISSRDEGGPKAVLEAMASGIPLISTKVGQATDLVIHGENGFLSNIEDAESLAEHTRRILQDTELRNACTNNGLETARRNDYSAQLSLWRAFMDGFIENSFRS